ncbi:MAG: methylmalonyl Co-A mutase-associated GTPase MeaB, partial [Betaproteobacteria bacterium]
HQARAQRLLDALLPHTGQSVRLGISGAPGAGKSTLIEVLGCHLTAQGHRAAVLAVDPSSTLSGGSILGDKTRMERLAADPNAFVRPSPSGATLGGVARKTREAMLACEAAGYDIVIVETVGVGQSETAVAGMTDCFLLLALPNAGDDLQAIKRGIVELVDFVLVNKADIDPKAAEMARGQIAGSLALLRPRSEGWAPKVLTGSARTADGIAELWAEVERYRAQASASGALAARRQAQALDWMDALIDDALRAQFHGAQAVRAASAEVRALVSAGRLSAAAGAARLLALAHPPVDHDDGR